jgi:HK97 family phage prohead protease
MADKIEKEIRNWSVRAEAPKEDSRTVEGYAALFDTPSDGLDFTEIIDRNAFDGVIARSDVFALLNHDNSRGILGRSKYGKGSLELSIDERGLKYRFDAPKSALGDELIENLKRGEVNESSFCFDVTDEEWQEDGLDDHGYKKFKRTIRKIGNLYDVSPVYSAAYSATTVSLRGKELKEKELEELEKKKKEAEKKSKPDESYYKNIENQFTNL